MIFIPSTDSTYVTATSYLTIAEADEFIKAQKSSDVWVSLPVSVKKVVLNQSSLAVDGVFSYKGRRTDTSQMLKFPRGGARVVPASLKYAVAMLALRYAKGEAFKGVTSESIGKMSWTFDKSENGVTNEVLSFLKPLRAKGVRID